MIRGESLYADSTIRMSSSDFQRMPFRRQKRDEPAEVLLVEDNPGDIRLLQEAFKEAGVACHLHTIRDGEQAMAYLHDESTFLNSSGPALILLDLNLPRKHGWEVLSEIKAEKVLRKIPVVILSTSTNPDDVQRAYDLHANCYLNKPGDIDSFISLSRVIESFWLKFALLAI